MITSSQWRSQEFTSNRQQLDNRVGNHSLKTSSVSHIAQFGDAAISPAGDADVSAGDAHL